jgi:hypothetical protein
MYVCVLVVVVIIRERTNELSIINKSYLFSVFLCRGGRWDDGKEEKTSRVSSFATAQNCTNWSLLKEDRRSESVLTS